MNIEYTMIELHLYICKHGLSITAVTCTYM